MTTVTEIEHAIEALPPQQFKELSEWLEEYQLMLFASSEVFAMLDAEEGEGDQWFEPTPPEATSGL